MRRLLGMDWRIAVAATLILILATGAVFYSRSVYGPASGAREASQTEEECETAKKANNGKTTKECKDFATLTLEDPIALYTFVLTVATIFLGVATAGLWYMAVKQSVDTKAALILSERAMQITREAAQNEARAYVRIKIISGEVREDVPVIFEVKIINYGKTPAFDAIYCCAVLVRDSDWKWPKVTEFDPVETKPSFVIHPGDDQVSSFVDSDFQMPGPTLIAVRNGSKALFCSASVFYVDAFGQPHETTIKFEFSGETCFSKGLPRMSPQGQIAT